MKPWEQKLITYGFTLAGVSFLIAGVLKPAIKGQPLDAALLGVGVLSLVLGIVLSRKRGGGASPLSGLTRCPRCLT